MCNFIRNCVVVMIRSAIFLEVVVCTWYEASDYLADLVKYDNVKRMSGRNERILRFCYNHVINIKTLYVFRSETNKKVTKLPH